MYLSLFLCCAGAPSVSVYPEADAKPTSTAVISTVDMSASTKEIEAVETQVSELARISTEQTARTLAVENFLTDKVAAEHGDAPRGWKQPSLEAYLDPDAPTTFLPAAVKP